jgi:hypothetical protein
MVFPVRAGRAMLALDAASCCDEDACVTLFESDFWDGITIGVPSLYFDPDKVVTTFFSAA